MTVNEYTQNIGSILHFVWLSLTYSGMFKYKKMGGGEETC